MKSSVPSTKNAFALDTFTAQCIHMVDLGQENTKSSVNQRSKKDKQKKREGEENMQETFKDLLLVFGLNHLEQHDCIWFQNQGLTMSPFTP